MGASLADPRRLPKTPRPRKAIWLGVMLISAAIVVTLTVISNSATTTARLVTATGTREIAVEVADTPETREVGLMNRSSMPADEGMLFDFEEVRPVTMWMKNTYIPLDMLFIDAAGTITHIAVNTQPLSLDIVPSRGAVRYVLELNGGAAARLGVRPGDRLEHPIIGPPGE